MSVNFPLLFFLLLVPLSGFIAWAGDHIGHRIGKRRHSIFGLRPRHTATVVTVAGGMLISFVWFGLSWASNAKFRMILAEGEALLDQNDLLKRQNRELQEDVTAQQAHAEEVRTEVHGLLFAKSLAEKERRTAESGFQRAEEQVKAAQADLRAARTDVRTTQAELRRKEQRVREARSAYRTAQTQVRRAERRVEEAQAKLQTAEKEIASRENTARALAGRTRELAGRVTDMSDRLARQQETLQRQRYEFNALAAETTRLEARRATLNERLTDTLTVTTDLRRTPIAYQVGQEVDRAILPAGMTESDIAVALRRLLDSAARKAAARGAAAPDGGKTVFILPKTVSMAGDGTAADRNDEENRILTEEDSIAAAAQAIRRDDQEVAVLVVASANAVEKEPVPVEFKTFRNRRVLRENTVLGTLILDGRQPQPAVADALYNFLHGAVRQRLRESGVIPPVLGPQGRQSDEEESYVSLSGESWFRVLDQVRRAGSPRVQIVVRAAKDLRAADPVALAFEVNPLRVAG